MPEITIYVTDKDGHDQALEAFTGWSLMEVLRDYQTGVKGECGGALTCATCHVYIDPSWWDRLPGPGREETDRLDQAFSVRPHSRLSCQITLGPEHDGLRLSVAEN